MPSHEYSSSPERRFPQWEIDLGWADLVVAVLERKVIPADALTQLPVGAHPYDDYLRIFRTSSGDRLAAWVIHTRNGESRIESSMWSLSVTPRGKSGENTQSSTAYRLHISRTHKNDPNLPYEINQVGSDIPLSPSAAEGLLNIVVQ